MLPTAVSSDDERRGGNNAILFDVPTTTMRMRNVTTRYDNSLFIKDADGKYIDK